MFGLRRLFGKPKREPIRKRVVKYRIVSPPETEQRENVEESEIRKKKEPEENEKEEDKIEDVEKAVELLKEACKYLLCPFCKARLLDEIEYLLTYDYKTKLIEVGYSPKEVDKIFEERYSKIVKRKIEELKKELRIGDMEFRQAKIEKAKKVLSQEKF